MAIFKGSAGNDSFQGSAADDTILGAQGADSLYGGGGNDLIAGGQGDDFVTVGGASNGSVVYGGEGADTVIAGGGGNTIVGGTGDAAVDATADGADLIDAAADAGPDVILGNGGADTIIGTTLDGAGVPFGTTVAPSILAGGNGGDLIFYGVLDRGAVFAAPADVLGNQGNDTISVGGSATTVYGGQGDDVLQAVRFNFGEFNQRDDVLIGGEGNDTIIVQGGNNTLVGGTGIAAVDSQAGAPGDGNDLIRVLDGTTFGNDLILGNTGDDTIDVSIQAPGGAGDTLAGGQGNDVVLVGDTADNLIFGNQGNDLIVDTVASEGDGAGNGDSIAGGQGDDTVVYGAAGETVSGLIYGNEGNNTVSVLGSGNDTIYGGNTSADGAGNGDGDGLIVVSAQGAGSSDLIFGGSGRDNVLVGASLGTFTIAGGLGNDVFGYASSGSTDSAQGAGGGLDVVADFVSGADKFALNARGTAVGTGDFAPTSVRNYGSTVVGATLQLAAANAIAGAEVANANAATFKFGSDFYLAADIGGGAGFQQASDILIDIKSTSSLTKNDFV